jgi:hypothetical protein
MMGRGSVGPLWGRAGIVTASHAAIASVAKRVIERSYTGVTLPARAVEDSFESNP